MSVEIRLKVLALGASSTGKTCFFYAMADCMKSGCGGFVFEAVDEGQRRELERGWESFSNGAEPPNSTTRSTTYNFKGANSNSTVATFSWLDYRGGAITGEPTAEKERIKQKMLDADFLMIFVGADEILQTAISPEQLRNLSRDERREIVGKVNALNERLACYNDSLAEFRLRNGRTVPVALVVTKGDLLGTAEEFDAAKSFMKEKFSSLFAPKAGWKVALMRCGLSYPQRPWHAGNRITRVYNIHLPVILGMCEAFKREYEKLDDERDKIAAEICSYEKKIEAEKDSFWLWRDTDKIKWWRQSVWDLKLKLRPIKDDSSECFSNMTGFNRIIMSSKETDIYDNGKIVSLRVLVGVGVGVGKEGWIEIRKGGWIEMGKGGEIEVFRP